MTDPWQELFFKVALAVNCLPSSFVDGNEHVFKAIEAARATPADPIRALIAAHAEQLNQNDYAYFELAYTRYTGWMAWLCSNSRDDDPNRKVLAKGQGDTPEQACAAAIESQRSGNGESS